MTSESEGGVVVCTGGPPVPRLEAVSRGRALLVTLVSVARPREEAEVAGVLLAEAVQRVALAMTTLGTFSKRCFFRPSAMEMGAAWRETRTLGRCWTSIQ